MELVDADGWIGARKGSVAVAVAHCIVAHCIVAHCIVAHCIVAHCIVAHLQSCLPA